jgi:adenine-specific DNA-methyltransferase
MPTLQWIGKEKVVSHHLDVPFRVLDPQYTYGSDDGNMIIRGDNLHALKALLPQYEGRVKCIYIDPPYNTGNEGWVYNDNVNDPKIRRWLGEVVGREGEDLSRHDKWLCMMYPRLRLLQQLLADDGAIFVSIDDNEIKYLRLIMDEIFGVNCFVHEMIWKNKYGPGAMTRGVGNVHEYILCYSKKPMLSVFAPLSDDEIKKYKSKDEHYSVRGGYITQPLATKSKDDRPNLIYPIRYNGQEIWPNKQWIWERSRMYQAIENDEVVFNENDGKYSVRFKQYLKDQNGVIRLGKPISILTGPYNQDGTKELEAIFETRTFNNPKPTQLIQYLFSFVFNGHDDKNGIYLDSFAGSGTTAHAVLNLNKHDGGNRRFILVEMEDYAEQITAERVRRVIDGYGEGKNAIEGTGGGFAFYELGEALLTEDKQINENVALEKIRAYVYFTETASSLPEPSAAEPYLLGVHTDTAYYFYYEKQAVTTLDHAFLRGIQTEAGRYLIYADLCALSDKELTDYGITFKKIPRDIARL